jgi:glycosyltransferase involved in cell wall biosynthesis
MRIGIDIRSIGRKRTGDETYTKGLVQGLLSIDHKNEYFLYTDTNNKRELEKIADELGELARHENVKIIPVLPASKILWTFYALPKRARSDKLDILHVQYITPMILAKKIALVTTIHDVSYKRYPEYIGTLDLLLLNLLIPISLRRADAVIGVSEFTKDEILQCYKLDRNKVKAISNGHGELGKKIELLSDHEKAEFRASKNLQCPYLFYLGTLQPRKNVPFLIESFEYLKEQYGQDEQIQKLELVIGGSLKGRNVDPKVKERHQAIKNESIRKSIRFVGYLKKDEMPFYFQCAQAYLNASLYEGFGLPLIESMAQRTPVICCNKSSFPEITGGAAIMFENNDKRDLVAKIMKLLNSEKIRKEYVDRGRENAMRFDWKKSAMQTMKLYDTIVKD